MSYFKNRSKALGLQIQSMFRTRLVLLPSRTSLKCLGNVTESATKITPHRRGLRPQVKANRDQCRHHSRIESSPLDCFALTRLGLSAVSTIGPRTVGPRNYRSGYYDIFPRARRRLTTTASVMHGQLTPPRPGEE